MTTISSTNLINTKAVSPVQKLVDAQKAATSTTTTGADGKTTTTKKSTDFTDQDWYIKAKVAQLKSQINTYSNLPGLDPSGGVIDSLTKEVNDLVAKQQKKLKATTDAAAAKQAELDKQTKQAALDASHADSATIIQRTKDKLNGISVAAYTPPDPTKGAADGKVISSEEMLAKVRGGNVNTTV